MQDEAGEANGAVRARPCLQFPALASILLLGTLSCGAPADRNGGNFVSIYDNNFSASVIRVPENGLVRWMHVGHVVHNVMAVDSSWRIEGGNGNDIPVGAEVSARFPKAGVYNYYCSYHGTRDGKGMAGVVVVGNVSYHPGPRGGALTPVAVASGVTRHVPKDYPTIQAAVDAANPGDLVLIAAGVYKEEVTVTTPSVVLRGESRNGTIVDGEFVRGNGIAIYADAVAVENMTARNAVLNGFYWTGVTGFRGSWLTAYNNGDYGIYAFGATDGVFEDSYASGSPDSGFYIGECYPCRIVVRRVIAEHNALGYSGTNSGGQMYVVSSIWRNNRVGIVPSSLDIELVPPQREAVFAANLIVNNANRNAPAAPLPSIAFGSGILAVGSVADTFERNVIADHPLDGIAVIPMLDRNFWRATDNVVRHNRIFRSGRADLHLGGPNSWGNCFAGNEFATSAPAGLEHTQGCGGVRLPMGFDPIALGGTLFVRAPIEMPATHPSYRTQPVPPTQPEMPGGVSAPVMPAMNVFDGLQFDVSKAELPAEAEQYLAAAPPEVAGPGLTAIVLGRWSYFILLVTLLYWLYIVAGAVRGRVVRSDGSAGIRRRSLLGWIGVILLPLLIYTVAVVLGALAYGHR